MNNNEVASYGQTRFKTILRKIKNDEEVSEEDRQYVTKKKLQNKQKSIKNRIQLQQKEHEDLLISYLDRLATVTILTYKKFTQTKTITDYRKKLEDLIRI